MDWEKIRAKRESGLTAVWLNRDPPVSRKISYTDLYRSVKLYGKLKFQDSKQWKLPI